MRPGSGPRKTDRNRRVQSRPQKALLRGYDTQQQKEVYVYAAGRQSSVKPASRPNYVRRVARVRVEYSGGAGRFGLSEKKNGLARVG